MSRLKKWTVFCTSIILTCSFTVSTFASSYFYEKIESEQVSSGVTKEEILRFSQDGWFRANVLYVDLTDEATSLDLLQSSGGLTTKESLSTMAKENGNVIGAINADFFYVATPDSPMGVMIEDGEMISSPLLVEHQYNSLYVNEGDQAFVDALTSTMKITTDKGKEVAVQAINKISWEYQLTTLIDQNWGQYSPGASETRPDHVEVVVVEDQVTEILVGQAPVAIPENGYILLASGTRGNGLLNNLQVGDTLELEVTMNPDIENIQLAVGGGTLLVKDGQALTSFTQDVSGNHPRTAVGITQDRSQLILVTIDGRHESYKGVNGQRMAQLMVEFGSHEAIMMDGGGSTTMITRQLGDFSPTLSNTPSDGVQRRIINGLAIVSSVPTGQATGIKVADENEVVFVNTPRKVTIKAYDSNLNPVGIETARISLELVSGEGEIEGNVFTPTKAGDVVLEVDYLGNKANLELTAMEAAYLEVKPADIQLIEGGSAALTVEAVSALGYRASIPATSVVWQDEKGLGTVSEGRYVAGNTKGESTLIGTLGNATARIPVSVGTDSAVVDTFESLKMNFTTYPEQVTGEASIIEAGRNGTKGIALSYDFSTTDATRAAYLNYENGGLTLPGNPQQIGVWVYAAENSTQWIRARVTDATGNQQVVDLKKVIDWTGWQFVEGALPANLVAPVKLDRIYVAETDPMQLVKGTLIFDDLTVRYAGKATTTVKQSEIKDPLYRAATGNDNKLLVHKGFQVSNETLLDRLVISNLADKANEKSTYTLFTGTPDSRVASKITNTTIIAGSGYGSAEYGEALILKMNNSSNGFRATDFAQWTWLETKLKNNEKKNLVFVLPKPIWGTNGFTDSLEAQLFADTLTAQAEEGKNVYVFYGGTAQNVELKDGVRYIATGTYQSNPQDPSAAHEYFELGFDQGDLVYQIHTIFSDR